MPSIVVFLLAIFALVFLYYIFRHWLVCFLGLGKVNDSDSVDSDDSDSMTDSRVDAEDDNSRW